MTVLCVSPRCRSLGQHTPDCADDTCRGCQPRQAADGLALCHVCTRRLGEDIAAVGQLHAELGLVLTMPERGGERVSGGGVARSLNLNERAIACRSQIHGVLSSWARIVVEERGWTPPIDAPAALASFLRRDVEWLAAHPAAGEIAAVFGELAHGEPYRVAYPTGARSFDVAPCPIRDEGGDWHCDGHIRVILRRTDSLLPSELVCSADGTHRWNSSAWVKLGRKLHADRAGAA